MLPPHALLPLLLGSAPAPAAPTCTAWGESLTTGECDHIELTESSGVAPLAGWPGHFATHNDAGGSARLYVFREDGALVSQHDVLGGGFRDWEDLARGPCPAGVELPSCLYIGDIGDNGESRDEIAVYVVPEPDPTASEPVDVVATWRLRYPDGPQDSEALAVHPCSGEVLLVTKNRDGDPAVFRLPRAPTDVVDVGELVPVAPIPRPWLADSGLVTGAAWSPGGDVFALRTYAGAWAWGVNPDAPDAHWETSPARLPIDASGQGESLTFHPEGGLLLTNEDRPMVIRRLPCAASVEGPACPPPEPADSGLYGGAEGGADSDPGPWVEDSGVSPGDDDPDAGPDPGGDSGPAPAAPAGGLGPGAPPPGCGCGTARTGSNGAGLPGGLALAGALGALGAARRRGARL
jgi:hypothetical protein